jgi:hypothetical protein
MIYPYNSKLNRCRSISHQRVLCAFDAMRLGAVHESHEAVTGLRVGQVVYRLLLEDEGLHGSEARVGVDALLHRDDTLELLDDGRW